MSRLVRDLRFALRTLLRAPVFAATVVLTLALGIGAATAIFSFVHGLLLRPLPFPDPERLVMVWQDMRAVGGPADEWFTPPDFVDLRDQGTTFSAVSGLGRSSVTLESGDGAERVAGSIVSPDYFTVTGVQPLLGRGFLPDEDLDARVIVLTHGFWQRRFGGAADVLGSTVTLSGQPFTIVGVMPPGFVPPYQADAEFLRSRVWSADGPCGRGCYSLRVLARVAPGVSVAEAAAEAQTIAARIAAEHATNENVTFRVVPLHAELTQATRRPLLALLGAVGFVLLIACVNIANLTLARNAQREREISIRTALGAGRRRLVRQLLTESVLLAVAGCVLGIAFAAWGIDVLIAMSPTDTPLLDRVAFSGTVFAFAAATAVGCGVLFGMLPALQATRPAIAESLKEAGSLLAGRARLRARSALIVAEIAVALVLLVGAGLLMKSFFRLLEVDTGYRAENVLLGELGLTQAQAPQQAQAVAFYDRLLERLGAHPDVAAVGAVTMHPLSGGGTDVDFHLEGDAPATTRDEVKGVWYRSATPGYRSAIGLRMVAGRWIEDGDHAAAPNVVVINETMARRYWPGEDPVGRRISMGSTSGPWWTIVGVAADMRHNAIETPAGVELFAPLAQLPERFVTVAMRTTGDPLRLAPVLRQEVRALDAAVPVAAVTTLEQLVRQAVAVPRLMTLLFGVFAGSALLLAAIGIYGVMASAVGARSREIGVRIALGAEPRSVRALFVRRALALVALGALIGTAGALVTARALASLLYEVAPADPAAIGAVVALLALVSLTAGYLPARRASRVDPMQVLRRD
jgi:putative ABC transport system permease protein